MIDLRSVEVMMGIRRTSREQVPGNRPDISLSWQVRLLFKDCRHYGVSPKTSAWRLFGTPHTVDLQSGGKRRSHNGHNLTTYELTDARPIWRKDNL